MSVPTFPHGFLKSVGSLVLAGALVACGGGSDIPPPQAPAAVSVATPVVAVAPASGATATLTQSGQVNYMVYRVNAAGNAVETTTLSAAVTNSVPAGSGTLSLNLTPTPLEVTTSDTWVNVIWPSTFKGVLSLEGNAGLVCETASLATTGQVGMSHNMQAVTTLEELKGLNFGGYDCSTSPVSNIYSYSFLVDGSLQSDDGMLEANDVAALFSEGGLVVDGLNLKLRAYKILQGGQLRYAMALLFDETDTVTGARSYGVELLLQN